MKERPQEVPLAAVSQGRTALKGLAGSARASLRGATCVDRADRRCTPQARLQRVVVASAAQLLDFPQRGRVELVADSPATTPTNPSAL
jgi:hypothetical protein